MYEEQEKERKSRFLFKKMTKNNTRAVSVRRSRASKPNTKLVLK